MKSKLSRRAMIAAPLAVALPTHADAATITEFGSHNSDGWHKDELQGVVDKAAYALEITGNSMQPVYREGDTIIVSPAAKIRRGDRVVVRMNDGQVLAKILQKQTSRTIELAAFNPAHPVKSLNPKNVDWMARIIWASQ